MSKDKVVAELIIKFYEWAYPCKRLHELTYHTIYCDTAKQWVKDKYKHWMKVEVCLARHTIEECVNKRTILTEETIMRYLYNQDDVNSWLVN